MSQRGEYRKILLGHISWLPFGDVLGYRHDNGVVEEWKYDQSYRLLEQKSDLHHFQYKWTRFGMLNRQEYAYTLADGIHRGGGEYEYHGGNRGRLRTEDIQRGEDYAAHYYRYDANGNRSNFRFYPLTKEEVSERVPWSWDEKRLSYNDRAQLVSMGDDEVSYQYDALGRRSALLAYTEEGSEYTKYKYEYGSDRRLRRIIEPIQTGTEGEEEAAPAADRVVAEYEYDYRGLRVKKTIGKQVRYFNYDDQGRLWSEHRPDGTVVREYVWLGYRPVHMVSYSQEGRVRGRYAIHVDHLGTPRMLTDRESRIVWLWESDAFGNGAANEDVDGDGRTVKFPLRFPGQYYDKETGLHYNWHRYYDPTIGRYITSDPIGLDGGMNTYAYANGNPLMYIDPLGLATYQCMKPLEAFGGDGLKSGPEWDINPLYHQYSCTIRIPRPNTCGGQDRSGDWWGSPGKPSNDSYHSKYCKKVQDDNDCFEKCLMDEWSKERPEYGIPLGTDCQEYDDDVHEKCRKKCNL